MDIEQVSSADAAACAEALTVTAAAMAVDCPEVPPPTERGFSAQLQHGWDGVAPKAYLGRATGGVAVGVVSVLWPTYDNRTLAWIDLAVHPDHRGRGHDDELLAYAEQISAAAGRTLLGLELWDVPDLLDLARRHGYEQKSVEVCRRQEIGSLDWNTVEKLHAEAAQAAADYELIRITGALPDDLLDGMVALTAFINDAPKDELEMEDDVYTPERLRAYEAAQAAADQTIRRVVARHRPTGELAGHTTIVVERERPQLGHQHDTAVAGAHRGHRLGALLKTDMLLWMRTAEPALSQVDTWNAESNAHMIGINEQLGYRILARGFGYQKQLG